ncbi:hypothetical protein NMY22_g18241 [Coprinellus aureogranulatus]|nr:hypothetical protein NMY22_g18241 [Coprinellus aureogranulatus]
MSTTGRPTTRQNSQRNPQKGTPSGTPTRPQTPRQATVDTYDAAVKVLKQAKIIKKESEVQNLPLLIQALRQHSINLRQPGQQSQLQASEIDAKIYDAIATLIEDHTNGYISLHEQFSQAITEATAEMKQELEKGLGEIKDAAAAATAAVQDTAQQVHNTIQAKADFPAPQSYADAARNNLTPTLSARDLSLLSIEARKIKLRLDPDGVEALNGKTAMEIKKTVEEALTALGAPEDVKIRLVTKFAKSESLVIEMKDDVSANWVKAGGRTKSLAVRLGSTVSTLTHWNRVKFVPVEFNIVKDLDELCEANDIDRQDIVKVEWLKKPENRKPDQKVANLKIGLANPKLANDLCSRGTIIHNATRMTEKMDREPTQCFKCQGYGHIAKVCLKPEQVCNSCGQEGHANTKATPCPNPDKQRCAICNTDGHGSKDRFCPSRIRKAEEMRRKYPGYGTIYHPTDEPWTWEQRDPSDGSDRNKYTSPPHYGHDYMEGPSPMFRPNSQWEAKQARKASMERYARSVEHEDRMYNERYGGSRNPEWDRTRREPAPFPMSPPATSQGAESQPSQPYPPSSSFPPGNQQSRKGDQQAKQVSFKGTEYLGSWDVTADDRRWSDEDLDLVGNMGTQPTQRQHSPSSRK